MNTNQSKKKRNLIILVSIIAFMLVGFSGVTIYAKVIQPKKFNGYIEQAEQYLKEERYDDAVLAFKKAKEIDNESIEANMGVARSYIGMDNPTEARKYLLEAQNLDLKNENLTIEMIELIKEHDRSIASEIVQNYLNAIGYDSASDNFKNRILRTGNNKKLVENIEKAQEIYDNAVEGNQSGNYKEGSKKELLKVIKDAKSMNEGYFYTQNEVDKMAGKVKIAIDIFATKKVNAMPTNLASNYRSRLQSAQNYWDNRMDNYTCFADFDDINKEALNNFEAVLEDIYSDLNKYLSESKKQELKVHRNNYYKEKQKMEYDTEKEVQAVIDEFGSPNKGSGWGLLESQAEFARDTCYRLINKYM